MSGDEGELSGAVALEQRPYGHDDHDPRVERDHQRRQQTEPRAVGRSRLIHSLGTLTLVLALCAVQVAWIVLLVRLGVQLVH